MATPAQTQANQTNATHSTGPRTATGKSRSAQNAITLGLFSLRNIIQPGEESQHSTLCSTLWNELRPTGPSEEIQAAEILRASWRLQRIANAEAALGDIEDNPDASAPEPVLNPATAATQTAIDRARQQTLRAHRLATTELRRLQTERQFRALTLRKGFDTSAAGLASYSDVIRPMATHAQWKLTSGRIHGIESLNSSLLQSMIGLPEGFDFNSERFGAERTQSAAPTPRNTGCPCGSGPNYKRCCGQNAAPVLSKAA
jgi:hypothetical protein